MACGKKQGWKLSYLYPPFLAQAKHVLKPEGLLLAKIIDMANCHRSQWAHCDFMAMAAEAGFTVCDLIVKVRTGPMVSTRWKTAHHARKRHCFRIICRNGASCERQAVRTHDPPNVDELGQNAARALMSYPPPPPDEAFAGAGGHALHHVGGFPACAGMLDDEPIHVGKANPPGGRQGWKASARPSPALHRRLTKHARSIDAVENLDPGDFRCRWLVLDPVRTGLTGQVLIVETKPPWNVVVEGFGINAPGRGRGNRARSQWDTLHPGRPEVASLPDREESAGTILEAIAAHRGRDTP